jgi:hypothetical protein
MNNLFKPLLILSVLVLGFFSSCKRTCDLGYEGKHCPTEIREKYLGERIVGSRTCDNGSGTDTINIQGSADDITSVKFQYLDGQPRSIPGVTRPDGSLYIDSIPYGTGKTITGVAVIENGKIKITYSIVEGSVAKNCVWIQN